ncbi:hypothetical protein H5410_055574 [Solanum commersonii]|uniref:Uncharacterized protein n=1 Tax=Solanum commersonii TaxID=4109 RepID=A0A9J5WK86_SOLCO|nr:hypothetical protein H5410_055574 [Solanum commersonii]
MAGISVSEVTSSFPQPEATRSENASQQQEQEVGRLEETISFIGGQWHSDQQCAQLTSSEKIGRIEMKLPLDRK